MRILIKGAVIFTLLLVNICLLAEEKPSLAILDVYGKGVKKTQTEIVYNYIIDKINKSGQFSIVERAMLEKALEELELSHSVIADEETASRLGKIAGAQYILISSLTKEEDVYYLAMRVVATETAKIRNTSIKNADSFKKVEQLTGDSIKDLLEVSTAPMADKASNSDLLTGDAYFFDDLGNKGDSKITRGMYLNNHLILEGRVTRKYEYGYIGMGLDLSEDSIKKARTALGIQFTTKGDDNYYIIKIKTNDITDFDFYYAKFFAPSKETVVQVTFDQLYQGGWGKKAQFNQKNIFGIEILTLNQTTLPTHIELINPEVLTMNSQIVKKESYPIEHDKYFYSDQDCPGDSQYTRKYWVDVVGFEGVVTKKCPYGFLAVILNLTEKGKKIIPKTKGVKFRVRGDGKDYRVEFSTPNVIKDNGWYKKVITATPYWTEVTILYSELTQNEWGGKAKWDLSDLSGITVITIGQPHDHVYIEMTDFEWVMK
ncbi:MAG: CIA30 family protein [Spirochaetales bacterium]|nr:CIA30 family protein [Spirochaetales bacterium]